MEPSNYYGIRIEVSVTFGVFHGLFQGMHCNPQYVYLCITLKMSMAVLCLQHLI